MTTGKIAKLRRWAFSGDPHVTEGGDGSLWVELELTHPKSSEGQRVRLLLDVEDVTDLLLALRDSARKARR